MLQQVFGAAGVCFGILQTKSSA